MRGRMVDATASDAVLDDKPDEAAAGQQPTTFAQARLAREVFSAKLKKLEYETRIGNAKKRNAILFEKLGLTP